MFERYQFWSHTMSSGITVDRFVTELRQRSKDCEFGRSEDDMLRDKLVFSINDTRLKERLLRETGLTRQRAIDMCRSTELAKTQIQAMPVTCEASIDDVQITIDRSQISGKFYKMKKQTTADCQKCGRQHELRQCPAYGALCHKCGKRNHLSKVQYVAQLVGREITSRLRL